MKMISLVFKNRRMTQQPKYQYFTYEQNNGIICLVMFSKDFEQRNGVLKIFSFSQQIYFFSKYILNTYPNRNLS
jgi:hypothetical protein